MRPEQTHHRAPLPCRRPIDKGGGGPTHPSPLNAALAPSLQPLTVRRLHPFSRGVIKGRHEMANDKPFLVLVVIPFRGSDPLTYTAAAAVLRSEPSF